MTNKDINDEGPLPEFIVKTTNESKLKFKIKDFKTMVSKYFVDKEINRLKLSFNISNKAKMKKMKTFLMDKIVKEYSF